MRNSLTASSPPPIRPFLPARQWPPETLLRLYHYTGQTEYLQQAEQVLRLYKRSMEQQPFGYGSLLSTLDFYLQKPQEIVLVGNLETAEAQALLRTIQQRYLPNKTLHSCGSRPALMLPGVCRPCCANCWLARRKWMGKPRSMSVTISLAHCL